MAFFYYYWIITKKKKNKKKTKEQESCSSDTLESLRKHLNDTGLKWLIVNDSDNSRAISCSDISVVWEIEAETEAQPVVLQIYIQYLRGRLDLGLASLLESGTI